MGDYDCIEDEIIAGLSRRRKKLEAELDTVRQSQDEFGPTWKGEETISRLLTELRAIDAEQEAVEEMMTAEREAA